jgi:hypothetical protein
VTGVHHIRFYDYVADVLERRTPHDGGLVTGWRVQRWTVVL